MGDTSRVTEREQLAVQYRDGRNLDARQSIYRYRRGDGPTIYEVVFGVAGLAGHESVLDVGCGNGRYLRALARRGHEGRVAGFDLSPGMAAEAHVEGPAGCADAQALPVRSASFDVALCPHMLYHVPDQAAAVAELRRVVRPGGRAVVVTNSEIHFREVDDMVAELVGERPMGLMLPFKMETGEDVLRTAFDTVERHDWVGALDVPDPEPVVTYVASIRDAYLIGDDGLEAIRRRVASVIEREGAFMITTASGAFVCS